VRVVVPYYERFVQRFPDVAALATAAEADVLALWTGLGYYQRARNLQRGARHLLEHHDGLFPRTLPAALRVPGVGRYTAGAVLSIAYGVPVPAVDGNVRRVLQRLAGRAESDVALEARAMELVEHGDPGAWNQALMELGASVCTPRQPDCAVCPLTDPCRARALGIQHQLPPPRVRRTSVDVTVAVAVVEHQGRVLLARRAEGKLLGRLWEVPQTTLEARGLPDLAGELQARHGLAVVPGPLLLQARHAITHRRILVEAYRARLLHPPPADSERFRWILPDATGGLGMSSLSLKVLRGLATAQACLEIA
jgi:A/G-specific adenine glycosylase